MPRISSTKKASAHAAQDAPSAASISLDGHSRPLFLAGLLIAWQKQAGRHDLPWQVRDPYRVWLSEIMLQQTQVTTVIPYYLKFLERFPDLAALASANEESVLAAWSGLGYYSRARNLHRCAQDVMNVHGGMFPRTLELLETLPGIGRSTAAAIAVFCFSKKEAILDGNVKRVLSRVFAIAGIPTDSTPEKELWQIALRQLPEQSIESYTQGLMDLGASLCTPRNPKCSACPLHSICLGFRQGLTHCLPTPKARKITPLREQTFALIIMQGRVLLERQAAPGIWGGLLSFPTLDKLAAVPATFGMPRVMSDSLPGFDHAFTHFKLRAKVVLYRLEEPDYGTTKTSIVSEPRVSEAEALEAARYRLLGRDQIEHAALPQPIKAYLLNQAQSLLL
jgi:A/G-specific adenine glycosylase